MKSIFMLSMLMVLNCAMAFNSGFYIINHMTNNMQTLEFAMAQGANAIEADLQFNKDGVPSELRHSKFCDCTCKCPITGCKWYFKNSVCHPLGQTSRNPCVASIDADKLLQKAASKKALSLVWLDSKLNDNGKKMSSETMEKAGNEVVKLIEDNLFKKGYKGVVLIGAAGLASLPYLKSVSKTRSDYKNRIYFTMDEVDMKTAKLNLDFPWNKNIVFNEGETGCLPKYTKFEDTKLMAVNVQKGVFGMAFSWTYNKASTMDDYIHYFNGMITNYPGKLAKIVRKRGIILAKPEDRIPPATSSVVETDEEKFRCDCSYKFNWFNSGCRITESAPSGMACYCSENFFSCKGWVVMCTSPNSVSCAYPDTSKAACSQGRGNCEGY